MPYLYRHAASDDIDDLKSILWLASNWRTPDRPQPLTLSAQLGHYLPNLAGRDDGFVTTTANGKIVGGAWYTFPTPRWRGYGYIADNIPEMTCAVFPRHQRQGIANVLMSHVIGQAKLQQLVALSLSCETDNHALDLYEKHGFNIDSLNGTAWTMLKPLFTYEP